MKEIRPTLARRDLVPVLDLREGVVVHAVRGQREKYRPISSRLTTERKSPGQWLELFRQKYRFKSCYFADLDAIENGPFNAELYRELALRCDELLLDAGKIDLQRWSEIANSTHGQPSTISPVVSLESTADSAELSVLVKATTRPIFSLDLRAGHPLTCAAEWREAAPEEILSAALAIGFRRFIVLDLADVGGREGTSTHRLIHWLRRRDEDIEIIGGGGVRCVEDVLALRKNGCDRVLVATALHDLSIRAEDFSD